MNKFSYLLAVHWRSHRWGFEIFERMGECKCSGEVLYEYTSKSKKLNGMNGFSNLLAAYWSSFRCGVKVFEIFEKNC